ncbi:uncharacterized protein LOC130723802 [Lotus japonicus]|uniref:uncharacterized protein LOC130723802 n=1 Tax=Lotus japonicus TaxID=34305 RepID=UPI00258BD733|nr:uncharacterized protein LOC130723802 [Lotus japonicus]
MEKNQEKMQYLGLFGIYKESYMVMLSWWKIFSTITLIFILPLHLIVLFQIEVSQVILGDVLNYSKTLVLTPQQKNPIETISLELLFVILIKLVNFDFIVLFPLLSISVVVYTVASIYTGREVTFKKVTSVVPKVFKRLMITLLCTFAAFFIYNIVVGIVFIVMWAITIRIREKYFGIATFAVTGILYIVGVLYLTIVWQLANVVSVLEDSCGLIAMKKSNELIKGKKGLSMMATFMFTVSFSLVQMLSMVFVNGWKLFQLAFVWRIASGVLCVLVLSHLILLMLVIQTVLYYVCKSYHHEIIDMSTLPEHLEVDCANPYSHACLLQSV